MPYTLNLKNKEAETYPYIMISDSEFYFFTKRKIKYDIYFVERDDIPIDQLQLLYNNKIKLYEFGFDKYGETKGNKDNAIFETIIEIFTNYNKDNKLLFSYVFNPTGKNIELNRLYNIIIKKVHLPNFTFLSTYVKTIENEYYYFIYYNHKLNIEYNVFISEIICLLKYLFANENLLCIKLTEVQTGKIIYTT